MKKISILLAVLVVLTAGTALGQDFTASANVLALLEIEADDGTNLDFGDVFPATSNVIEPTSGDALQYNITGANNESFYIAIPETIQLTGDEGQTDEITFLFNVVGNDEANNSTGTSAVVSNGSATPATLSSTGEYYIFVGGSLHEDGETSNNIPAGIETGAYSSGVAVIEVGYDSF